MLIANSKPQFTSECWYIKKEKRGREGDLKLIRAVAEELNRKGIKPKKAAQWNPSSVHKVLKRVA